MISVPNVSSRVFPGGQEAGSRIYDVYLMGPGSLEDRLQFITGHERSSVAYNAGWLGLFVSSVCALAASVAWLCGVRVVRMRNKA